MSEPYRLVYASRMTPETEADVERVLDAILEVAVGRNAAAGLTGLLIGHLGRFFQALEGAPDAVETVFDDIAHDPRHHDVQVLTRGPVRTRLFERWAMCARHLSPTDEAILQALERRPAFTPTATSGMEVLALLETVAAIHPRTLSERAARHAAALRH